MNFTLFFLILSIDFSERGESCIFQGSDAYINMHIRLQRWDQK